MSKFKLSKGKKVLPDFITLFGVDGVGKTSFAASAPKPVVIDIEKGSYNIDTNRIDENLDSFSDVINAISFVSNLEDCKTVIVDSVDRLETLAEIQVCKEQGKKSMEDFGYGAGHKLVQDKFEKELIPLLKMIRETKNVVLIAHDIVRTFKDPTLLDDYDRHEIKLNKKIASLIREEVDAVLFINYKTMVKKTNKNDTKGKGLHTDEIVLYTERRPGHEAKNRFGLPYEISLSDKWEEGWSIYQKAKGESSPEDPQVYVRQILNLLPEVKDEETRAKIEEAMKEELTTDQLKKYLKRVESLIEV